MDGLFDVLLTLAPIALFIALRIYASRKEKAAHDERARLAQFLSKAAKEEEAPRPTFAQLSALADAAATDEEPEPASGSPAVGAAGRGMVPAAEARESLPLSEAAPPSVRPIPPASRGTPRPDLLARLERMSPLKRAVVMAELLGPPKGL